MAYTLTARQLIAYTDRFDVYRAASPWAETSKGFKNDVVYSQTPVYADVPCLWMNQPDINSPRAPLGRTLMDSSDVLDMIHFPAGVDLRDQDALHLKTPDHPQKGEWFIVMGFGSLRTSRGNRKGNYLQVRAKRMMAPPRLEGV